MWTSSRIGQHDELGRTMNILCFNPGSGTLRYRLFDMDRESELAGDMVDRIKGQEAVNEAASGVLDKLRDHTIDAVAVRVVHGGDRYQEPTRVDDELVASLREIERLAPLHVPVSIGLIELLRNQCEHQVFAVFDTMFHRNLPDAQRYYPLAEPERTKYRRFGFHGFAHQSVCETFRQDPARVGNQSSTERIISLHFGGGASACAIRDGQSVATTMGMTPMDGLMMSSRSGSIDPGIVLMMIRKGRTVDEVDELLNQRSGLLGVSGISDDTRDILPAIGRGDANAKLAIEMYADRVRQAIGAYIAVLGGCDALLISGALVKESPEFRWRLLSELGCFNIEPDRFPNDQEDELTRPTRLNRTGVTIAFIPAAEELQMARAIGKSTFASPNHQ